MSKACGAILRNEYMDDYLDSRTAVKEAVRLVRDGGKSLERQIGSQLDFEL
jgi:hypothetical protein